jgi:hypothetical protein
MSSPPKGVRCYLRILFPTVACCSATERVGDHDREPRTGLAVAVRPETLRLCSTAGCGESTDRLEYRTPQTEDTYPGYNWKRRIL